MTICTMQEFGADVEWADGSTIRVKAGGYKERPFFIENDWSASSYWYEMAALMNKANANANITLTGLMDGSRQGDSAIRYMFSVLGVKTAFKTRKKLVPTNVALKAQKCMMPRFDFDFINQPDLAQTLVVCTALMGIPFRFSGLQTLRIKETDRIAALKKEMKKLGYVLDDSEEGVLSWDGTRCEPDKEPAIDTYEDHRMALAFAPMALKMPISINNPQVVTKSYPRFWEDLEKAGFAIEGKSE